MLLDPGEANLPKQSVVVVSQVDSVEKSQLGEYIGTLSAQRVDQILAGMRFQQASFFMRTFPAETITSTTENTENTEGRRSPE